MSTQNHNNDNQITEPPRQEYEWSIDVCDTSIRMNHQATGLSFSFRRDNPSGSISDDVYISGDENCEDISDYFDAATQIAEEIAAEEWGSRDNTATPVLSTGQ